MLLQIEYFEEDVETSDVVGLIDYHVDGCPKGGFAWVCVTYKIGTIQQTHPVVG